MASVKSEESSERKLETKEEDQDTLLSSDDSSVESGIVPRSGGPLSAGDLPGLHGSMGNQAVQSMIAPVVQSAPEDEQHLPASIDFRRYYNQLDEYARGRANDGLRTLVQLLMGYEHSSRKDAAGAMSAHDANLRLGQLEEIAEACKGLQLDYTAKLPEARDWRMNERQQRHDDKPKVKARRKQEKALEIQRRKDTKEDAGRRARGHDIQSINGMVTLLKAMIQLNDARLIELVQTTQGRMTAEENERLETLQREQASTRADLVKQQRKLGRALAPRSITRVVSDEEKAQAVQRERDQEQTTLQLARMNTALALNDDIHAIQLCIDELDQAPQLSSYDQERRSRLEAELEHYKQALILHSATRLELPESGKLEQLVGGVLALKATAQLRLATVKQVPGKIKKTVSDEASALARIGENALTSPLHHEIRLAEEKKEHDRIAKVKAARRRGIVDMLSNLQQEIAAERRRVEQGVPQRDPSRLGKANVHDLFGQQGLVFAAAGKVVSRAGKVAGRYNPAKMVAGEHVVEEGILLRPALFAIEELEEVVRAWGDFENELEQAGDWERNRSTVLVQWRSRGRLPVNLLPVDTSPEELLAARARILLIEMELREKNDARKGKKPSSDGLIRQAIDFSSKAKSVPIAGLAPTTATLLKDMFDIVSGDEKKKASARQHIKFHILDVCAQVNTLGNIVNFGAVAGEFIPYANIPIAMLPVLINSLRLLLVELEREMFTGALEGADKDDPLRIPFAQIEGLLLQREARLAVAAGTSVVRTGVAIAVNAVPVPGVGVAAGVLGVVTTSVLAAEDFASSQSRAVKAKRTRDDFLSGGAGAPALEHDPKTALLSIIQSARDNCVPENPAVRIIESLGVKREDIRGVEPQELLSMFMMVLDLSEDAENLRGNVSGGVTSLGEKLTKARRRVIKHSGQRLTKQEKESKSKTKRNLSKIGFTFHDVSGSGLNCLIRALLLASGQNGNDVVVNSLRAHLESQHVAIPGDFLDLAGPSGAILLSEMERRGLLDGTRAILLYTPERGTDPIPIVEGDMEQPIRLWLENGHFQVIAAPGPGKLERAAGAAKGFATMALTTTSAGRAYFREQSTIEHIEGLKKVADDIQKAASSERASPFDWQSLQALQDIVIFALAQKSKKEKLAHRDIGLNLLPVELIVSTVGSAAGSARKAYQGKPRGNREHYARALIELAKKKDTVSASAMDVLRNLLDGDKEAIRLALSHDDGWTIVANKLRSR